MVLHAVSFAMHGQTDMNKVYWVHGFGDSSYIWDRYKNDLVDYGYQGERIDWNASFPLGSAADELNRSINREVASSGKAIVFGHSAGGLVARKAALSNSKIRAIITAGTPNNGAGIVTSLNNRSFNNVAEMAIRKADASLVFGHLAVGTLLPGVGNAIMNLIANSILLIGTIGESLANDAIEDIKGDYLRFAAAGDMDPNNSSFLKALNGTAPKIPIINLYGKEDDNKLVRIAGTLMHKEENDSPDNTTYQCYDEAAFPLYNKAISTCTTFEVYHGAVGATAAVAGIFYPQLLAASGLNLSAAVSWSDTRRFIQYDVHNEWDSIIGATHVDRIENWHKFLWIKWCDVEYVTVYEDSDGFIPNKSSKMDGLDVQNIEVPGVNHLEMNNNPSMRQRLSDILKGSRGNAFNYKY